MTSLLTFGGGAACASIAYGTINNFDAVNDTGQECHGFEIEIEGVQSTDITYTYNWNHYSVPKITQGGTSVLVRYESAKNPDGTWAAFTAIPATPIAPTDGHQFTNPSVNFGGEHFGVGYRGAPTAIKYNWLVDDGFGNLVHGPPVQLSTPTFIYAPPAGGAPPQVQAVIKPPPPPAPEPLEFGKATWVKEIRTTSHNNSEVLLRDLVDPGAIGRKDWRNGEPDEVEVEWQILQTDYNSAGGGANGELAAAPEELPNGDEVVTRRYEFYEYTGPIDNETGEAMAQAVAPDGIHGVGTVTVNGIVYDLTTIEVVGKFLGAQMSGFDAGPHVGLIDHLEDGEIDVPYTDRTVVIAGDGPFTATSSGTLPAGMTFDAVTGIVSGTPSESGVFSFTITVEDANTPAKSKTYTLTIAAAGVALAPHSTIDTGVLPLGSGVTTGDGPYDNGVEITVVATPKPGFSFVNWTENGVVVSGLATYHFTTTVNRSLTANFVPGITLSIGDLSVAEGNSGSKNVTFTVTLSAASVQTVKVDCATVAGTTAPATAGVDYVGLPLQTLTFAPGETAKLVTVSLKGDLLFEANETFLLQLSNSVNASIADDKGQLTILNDDAKPVVSISSTVTLEGNAGTTTKSLPVTLSAPAGVNVTVHFATIDSTAKAGADYTSGSGTLTFTAGQTSALITVTILGDTQDEDDETFKVALSNPLNATAGIAQGTVTITDDDATPSLVVTNPRAFLEGSAAAPGSTTLNVILSAPSGRQVKVNFATANGTAIAGSDYVAKSGTLIFVAGQTRKSVVVTFIGDAVAELNETIFLDIKTPVNATIADSRGSAYIGNDDGPTITIDNAKSVTEGSTIGQTTAQNFVVKLSATSTNTITVDWTTANGTAGPADYTVANGRLTFAPGETQKTITVLVKQDTTVETSETYRVNLTRPIFAIIGDSQGVGYIINDDIASGSVILDQPNE